MSQSFPGKRQLELWFDKRLICPIIKDKDCFDQQKNICYCWRGTSQKSLELPKITSTSPSRLFQSWLVRLFQRYLSVNFTHNKRLGVTHKAMPCRSTSSVVHCIWMFRVEIPTDHQIGLSSVVMISTLS